MRCHCSSGAAEGFLMCASISLAYWAMSACKPAGPRDRSSSIAANDKAAFSEIALRARTSAGSAAREICVENKTSRSNERKRDVEFIGNLQTRVEALRVEAKTWLPRKGTKAQKLKQLLCAFCGNYF